MKFLTLLLTTLFLFSSPLVWSEEVRYQDLIERGGLYYKKFSEEPFTGNVVGTSRGKFVKGKREGRWTFWRESGQLELILNYKNGKRDGLSEKYWEDGQLARKGYYKNDRDVGKWEYYNREGTPKTCREYKELKGFDIMFWSCNTGNN